MKCDAGDVACAINRLTEVVEGSGGVSWFDWVTRFVLPLFLGLVTASVALLSLRLAIQSNRLTVRVREEERDHQRYRERADLAIGFRDLVEAYRAAAVAPAPLQLGVIVQEGVPHQETARLDEARARVSSKAHVTREPGAVTLYRRINDKFAQLVPQQNRAADLNAHYRAVIFTILALDIDISTWTNDPVEFIQALKQLEEMERAGS